LVKTDCDPAKRELTLVHRGLDMARAGEIFDGPTIAIVDDRKDYGELRQISIGKLDGRMVVAVWTSRGTSRRIISLRKANEREQKIYGKRLGGS
jgi:uncharacterized protein